MSSVWAAVLVGLVPVDEAQDVGGEAQGHGRELEGLGHVVDEHGLGQVAQHVQEALGARDGVLGLPEVVEELGAGHIGVGRDAPPEVAAEKCPVVWPARMSTGEG